MDNFRQKSEEETSHNTLVNTVPNDENPIKTRVNGTLNTINPSDSLHNSHQFEYAALTVNWWARRDLNPENKTHNASTNNNLQDIQNTPLSTICPKSQAQSPDENPQQNVLLDAVLNKHDLSLAQAIIAIDQLPIDSSTKVSLIKELATKLTESTEPESPEDSPNA